MTENTSSTNLQEVVDKVLPPYTGNLKDALDSLMSDVEKQAYQEAVEYASQFDSTNATREEWMRLDWALAVPGVAEQFPELNMELQMYFTLQITEKDFLEVIANVILATSNIVRDVVNSENTIDCFRSTFQYYLPGHIAVEVEKLLTQEAINQCDRELLPVDNSLR